MEPGEQKHWLSIATTMITNTPPTVRSFITITQTIRLTGVLDDFFVRALIAGSGVALLAGPFGCFVIWRRMAYFGDTMAHSALLGITLSLIFELHSGIGVFVVAGTLALALVFLQQRADLPTDTLLGILSHSTLALGLIAIGLMARNQVDLLGYLFGDVLAVNQQDLLIIWIGGSIALLILALIWRPLLASTVNEELARAEEQKPQRVQLIYLLLLAAVIAMAIKIVGILLITALLVIPAATARRFSPSPESMAVAASLLGVLSVVVGLSASLSFDTAAGPSIVVASLLVFVATLLIPRR